MTILEKIDAFVASQGNQVGGGSEFAELLKEIATGAPEIEIDILDSKRSLSKSEFLELTGGYTIEQIANMRYIKNGTYILTRALVDVDSFVRVAFGIAFGGNTLDIGAGIEFSEDNTGFSIIFFEI